MKFYDLIRSAENGIDDEESEKLINRFTKLANKKIDIPYIPEMLEGFAIKLILQWAFKVMLKNFNIEFADIEIMPDEILNS